MKTNEAPLTIMDSEYRAWLASLGQCIRSAQVKAAVRVNSELLRLYWRIGGELAEKTKTAKWGEGWLESLSRDLLAEFPEMKGFSSKNLRSIRQWRTFYDGDSAIRKQAVSKFGDAFFEVPWGHHLYVLQRCKTPEKALFYLRKTAENNWSRSTLLNFLDTDLYEREGKAVTNFPAALPTPSGDLAQNLTRDPYCFDFLSLTDDYNERQLKAGLVANIEKFLLELGTGFAYMGREYRLEVGETEQFLDMLFYNVRLRCYVVIEVKTSAFKPEFLGQLGAYAVAVDHILRKEDDNKTIGLLVCKTKDNVLARYALESTSQPIGISEYELSKLYPERVEGTIPTTDEIEARLVGIPAK
ncbi:MAG: DUF1016 family protein [Fibrobacterales bacterium]|nr:DUF1016 family protein [Fibrobacterales bacterium]